MASFGKGFGCRPEHERSIRYRAGVRKPPKNEPAGKRRVLALLWGFGMAAALAGDGFAKIAKSWELLMIADWPLVAYLTA
jgi:hypothetical protein